MKYLSLIIFTILLLTSCGSPQKNNERPSDPATSTNNKVTASEVTAKESEKKQNIENIRIAVLLNKPKFNHCFKVYLSKEKVSDIRRDWLVIRWRIYDQVPRDITVVDSYAKFLDRCFAKVVGNTSFKDVYRLPTISTVTFPFLITPSGVDLDRNIDLR